MRSVVLVAALIGAPGCGKRINPAWCQQAENQSAAECPAAIADAAVQETSCHANPDCASDPLNKFCRTDRTPDVCVECLLSTDCPDPASPVCTSDNVCLPCAHDSECGDGSHYCQDGHCLISTSAYFASPAGNGDPAMCLQTAPCSLTDGVARALAGGKVLRLIGDSTGLTFKVANQITLASDIRISGVSGTDPSTRIIINGNNLDPVFKITTGRVELDYVVITGAKGTAIACTGGKFTGRRLHIHDLVDDNSSPAFSAAAQCDLTLEASVIMGNKHGAIDVSGSSDAPFGIRNNVFAKNLGGPAVTLHGNGRFEYNTVADNRGKDGTSGVLCSQADGVTLDMNILANNALDNPPTQPGQGNKPPTVLPAPQYQGCTLEHGFSDDNVNLQFAMGNDAFTQYSLTLFTPLSVVNISDVVCAGLSDIDMALRPAHARCDMGADECANCQFNDPRNTGYQEQGQNGQH
jgi:hypothetical protein